MPNTSFLVPTRTFFQKPIFDEVTGLKQLWLQEKLGVQYRENLSTQQKWTSLIASFSDSIERAGLPFDTQTLRRYQASRLIVLDNQNNLSLAKTLDYFEFFYFFFDNAHPKFSLSQDKKISLLRGLFEAIGPHTCEVGRGARFEAEFNLWLKTNDILFDELYKMRNGIIEELAVRYNTEHHVGEAMSVHTVYAMKKYVANRFGLANVHEVQDVYLSNASRTAIHQYVDTHAQAQFDLYIEEAAQRLSICVLGQIEELLGLSHENKETLKHSSLKLTSDQYQVMLYPYLGTLLCFSLYEDNRNLVDGITIEDDDELGVFHLERYDILRPKLKFAIEQVLTQKGYFVNLAQTSAHQLSNQSLILKPGINVKTLLKVYQSLYQPELGVRVSSKETLRVINMHPKLIVEKIWSTEQDGLLIPRKYIYQPFVLDNLKNKMIELLAHNNEATIEPHIVNLMLQVLKIDARFISKLEPYLSTNLVLAYQLSDIDPKFSHYLPQEQVRVVEDDEIEHFELEPAPGFINRLISFFGWVAIDPEPVRPIEELAQPAPGVVNEEILNPFEIEKNLNIETLKNTPLLDLGQVVQRLLNLNPQELIDIANHRQRMEYMPFPFYDEVLIRAFEQETNTTLWQNEGYQAVRKDALQTLLSLSNAPYSLSNEMRKKCLEAIVNNESWYLAYLQYYQMKKLNKAAFKNLHDFAEQLQKNVGVMIKILIDLKDNALVPIVAVYFNYLCCIFAVRLANFLSIQGLILLSTMPNLLPVIWASHLIFIFAPFLAIAAIVDLNDIAPPSHKWLLSFYIGLPIATTLLAILSQETVIATSILWTIMFALEFLKHAYYHFVHQQPFLPKQIMAGMMGSFLLAGLYQFIKELPLIFVGLTAIYHVMLQCFPLVGMFIETCARTFNTLKTGLSQRPELSESERLENKVNAAIERLLSKDSDSAHRKGELLFNLWDKIKDEHANGQGTYQNLFNKDYEIDGVIYTFKSVASATRLDEEQFNPQIVDNRFSFFGLRGSQTAADLQAYLSPQLV